MHALRSVRPEILLPVRWQALDPSRLLAIGTSRCRHLAHTLHKDSHYGKPNILRREMFGVFYEHLKSIEEMSVLLEIVVSLFDHVVSLFDQIEMR